MKIARKKLTASVPSFAMGDIGFLVLIFFVILARVQDDSHVQWDPAVLSDLEAAGAPMANVAIDSAYKTYLNGEELELTSKEFDLLALLMSKPDATFTREQIMSTVWDENYWGSTRTLDTHISTLRRKIGDDTDPPTLIVTVRGVGFRFEG